MPRSARRRSAPSSPAKSRKAPTPPRQSRRSTRTQNREPANVPARDTRRQQSQLEPVHEQEDTIDVHDASHSVQSSSTDAVNRAGDVDESAESGESLISSSNDNLADLDHTSITDSLVDLNNAANDLLGQVQKLSIDEIAKGLLDPESSTSRKILSIAKRLQNSSEPCGRAYMLPLHALAQLFADHNLPSSGPCLIFMKANLARFILALFNVKLADKDFSFGDCLQHLTIVEPFPEPFLMLPLEEQIEPTGYGQDFEQKTLALGVSILTQLYIGIASDRINDNDFDPDLLLQQIFTDEDGNLRDVSMDHISERDSADLTKAVERRLRDISKYTSTNAALPLDLQALQRKYSRKAFLEQAAAWAKKRAKQLNEAIEAKGSASAIRDVAEMGPHSVTPKPAKQNQHARAEQSRRRSRQQQAMEEGTSFLREMDDELDAAEEEESHVHFEEASGIQGDDGGIQADLESEAPRVAERQPRDIIPESPQVDEERSEVLQGQLVEADGQLQAAAVDAVDVGAQIEQDVPDSAQPLTDWAIRPTQETLDVLNVTQRQEKESNKENSPPHRRHRLLDRQPDAQRINFEDDDTQSQDRNRGKRPRSDDENTDDEDAFEADRRTAKRRRPQNGRTDPVPHRIREDRSESGMFVNDSEEPKGRPQSRASSQPVTRRPRATNPRAAPASTQPPPHRAPAAPASPRYRSASASAPPPSSYEGYLATKRQAQVNNRFASLVAATTKPRPPQARRAWDAAEIRRLIQLMEIYGTSWAKIKQADERMDEPLLINRSQVQLKDKARNMKLDFLKAEQPLPEYMEAVTISKGHREMLRGMGIGVPGDDEEE